jgi:glycosyltransferase involved in cell wall biosynthesis
MTRTLVVALLTLGDPGRLTGGYLYHRRLADLASRSNARVEFVSFPERPFPLGVRDASMVLRRARSLGAQVLIIDSIVAASLGPWVTLRHSDIPLVGMAHQPPGGIDYGALRTHVQAYLDRLTYRRVRRLLVASDLLADQMRAAGLPPRRIRVVPPGRDVSVTVGAPAGDLRRGRRAAILCVGNWVERKGIHSLLRAFAPLPADAATLHLVGDDQAVPQYAAQVRERLAQADLVGRVVVHGPRTLEDVAALYEAADVFVLPSLKEPYGTVYGEAMAAGLPVVGWRAGNLPYLAEHEREGLLVSPGDVDGLTRALRRIVEDEALRRRLGEAACIRALARPTWEETAARFFSLVREVTYPSPSEVHSRA